MRFPLPVIVFALLLGSPVNAAEGEQERPNFLLIICDDLNDMVEGFGGHPQAHTPNLERLGERGFRFLNAHVNSPLCAPSRASFLSGLYPHTTGYYAVRSDRFPDLHDWRRNPLLASSRTFLQHFRSHGYRVLGTGKIFHQGDQDLEQFDEFGHAENFGPWPWDGRNPKTGWSGAEPVPGNFGSFSIDASYGRLEEVPQIPPNPETGAPGHRGWRLEGAPFRVESSSDRDLLPDERNAAWAVKQLKEEQSQPFLMVVGMNRPHVPLVAPGEYFDLFDPDELALVESQNGILRRTLPDFDQQYDSNTSNWGNLKYQRLVRQATKDDPQAPLREWTHAYLANVAFVDAQIGRILDALEASKYAENTVIIVTSDHGYHLGEREWLFKNSVWEEATRVPLIFAGRGIPVGKSNHPVSLVDLYPTLNQLVGLPNDPNAGASRLSLDGHSLVPLMHGKETHGSEAALTVVGPGERAIAADKAEEGAHWSLRSENFRYIRHPDGIEEFYDHRSDPHEQKNLVADPEYATDLKTMRQRLSQSLEN